MIEKKKKKKKKSHNATKLKGLCRTPFRMWCNGQRRFRDHAEKSPLHQTSSIMASHFRQHMEQKRMSINVQLDTITAQQVKRNREKLIPIVGTVILCGRQNIALRGHRDISQYYDIANNNPGNFQEILKFLSCFGKNSVFEDHLQNAPKSATYRSKTIQNEIIAICEEIITSRLVFEIKEAKFFSILADEAADISKKEQMPLVIRFVDKSSTIREVFTGFIHCDEGVSGDSISKEILSRVKSLALDMHLCQGQRYDGAGNLSGKCSGAAARIQEQYRQAPYVHCGSHVLNLCIAAACTIHNVSNMMGNVRVISDFFNRGPKRFSFLEYKIKEMLPESRHTHLINVCRTRWVARIDGLDIFAEAFVPIIFSLEAMKVNEGGQWNPTTVNDASGLFHAATSFEFIFCLITVSCCLEVTHPLTKQLQAPTFDVVTASEKVSLLFASLQLMRKEKCKYHGAWYTEAEKLASSVNVCPSKPHTVKRQTNPSNKPADDTSQYYECTITLPFLDHLISQIHSRFSDRNMAILNGFYAFPTRVVSLVDWKQKFELYLRECMDDLPEPRYINAELNMWEIHCKRIERELPATLSTLLPTIETDFPKHLPINANPHHASRYSMYLRKIDLCPSTP